MTQPIQQPLVHPSRTEVIALAKMAKDSKVGVIIELADRLGWGIYPTNSLNMIRLGTNPQDRSNWIDIPMKVDANDNVWNSWVKRVKRYAAPNRLQRFDIDAFLLEVKLDRSHAHELEKEFGSKRKQTTSERLDAAIEKPLATVTPITGYSTTTTPGVLIDDGGLYHCADCEYTHLARIGVIGHRAGKHNPEAVARRVATRKQNVLVKQVEADQEAKHQREIERKREYRRRKKAEKEQAMVDPIDTLHESSRDQEMASLPGKPSNYLDTPDLPHGGETYKLDSLHDFTVAIEHVINAEVHRRMKGLEDALADQMERAERAERRADAAERKLEDVRAAVDMLKESAGPQN